MQEFSSRYLRTSQRLTLMSLVATAALTLGLRVALHIPFPFELQVVLFAWIIMGLLSQWTAEKCKGPRGAEIIYFAYFLFGCVFATLVTHYTSGVEWIGPIFYCFVVMYANLLLRPTLGGVVVVWAVLLYGAMAFAEYLGFMSHYNLFTPSLNLYKNPYYVTTMTALASMLLTLLAHAVSCLARALRAEHRAQVAANEQLARFAETLEQRVQERTHELRKAQDQLVQAGKCAAAGQLASGLAREFNNPLAIVKGFADLAMRRHKGVLIQSSDELADLAIYIDQIRLGAQRCQAIVEAITQFANPAADREWTSFNMNDAVTGAVAAEHQRAQRADVQVLTHLARNLPVVEGNAELMQQAIAAVLANAIDASQRGDCVRVRTMSEWLPDQKQKVIVAIDDCGPGITEDELNRIFDPFYSGKEVGAGLGLGLSVSEAIVREHGGNIEAHNLPEGGARFSIGLPEAEHLDLGIGAGIKGADGEPGMLHMNT